MRILTLFKDLIESYYLDGYLVPKNDEYFNEYSNPNRLYSISNFSGSAGIAMILKKKNYLFVDGRYKIQAEKESGRNFKILEVSKKDPKYVLKSFTNKINLGIDPKLFTNFYLKKNIAPYCNIIPVKENLVDKIIQKKINYVSKPFYTLSKKISGENKNNKITKLIQNLKIKKIDNIFISAPENVAWLLNIRGFDNPNSPIPNCQLILNQKREIYLLTDKKKFKKIKNQKNYENIKLFNTNELLKILLNLKGKSISIDRSTCSSFNEQIISKLFFIKSNIDPCYKLKSIKNKTEINNMIKAHIEDGIALTKFIYWMKNNRKQLDELNVKKKINFFRNKNKNYLFPSFSPIIGSGPNGAIVHYNVNKNTNRRIRNDDLLLFDTGGQYKFGTTDVTRTICFKKPSIEIKNVFTRVLKGHISVALADLNKLKNGKLLDKIARKYLNEVNLDYEHGTGHGVGYFLNVHEGPQSLSKYNIVPLEEGMILSNEPGFYKKNKYGIRIENLLVILKNKNKKFFKNLTLVPIDFDLINLKLLNNNEIIYLKSYHKYIYKNLSLYLNKKERIWLKSLI